MAKREIFVGRKGELREFERVLEYPRGQAIIVVGNRGMGKTWIVNRMAKFASEYPKLKCGFVRYEVTPTDSPDSTMALMLDNAFEAANTEPGSFDNVPERKRQWLALFKTFVPRGEQLAELMMSLRRDPAKDTRQQFLERLELISKRMPENGRAIFIVDPEKYMAKESDQTWAIVVKSLPEKIKFIFAQRTEDVLVDSEVIDGLDNIVKIPGDTLDALSEEDVDELVNCRRANLKVEISDLRKVMSIYKGHPYAVGAALDLVEAGTKIEELPKTGKPTEFAAKQWEKIGEKGDGAIKLFEAYAVLEVAVPDDVVEYVSELNTTTRKRLQNDKYLRGLLRDEAGGRRIYHSILADYILGQMSKEEKKEYHKRAVEVYRGKLKKAKATQTKPDELAAVRLAEHVLEAEGSKRFVEIITSECYTPLFSLGLLNDAIYFLNRALKKTKENSAWKGVLLSQLGQIYQKQGKLDKAEKILYQALRVSSKVRDYGNVAVEYGNIGSFHLIQDDLKKAEEMYRKALEIGFRVGDFNITNFCNNLGLIYRRRKKLDKAEEMHKMAIKIHERTSNLKGLAENYANLGPIYHLRGELGKAKKMYVKAMKINERIGDLNGLAINYGNLGLAYLEAGDLTLSEGMFCKALEIDERIGDIEGLTNSYVNLGTIYRKRGMFDKAEKMFKKSLAIAKKLGVPEIIAIRYKNLCEIYVEEQKLGEAEEACRKALDIFELVGNDTAIAACYGTIGKFCEKRGDLLKAREYWEKALDLFKKIGMPNEVKKVEEWMEEHKKANGKK